jgi:vitamin B12 transporter
MFKLLNYFLLIFINSSILHSNEYETKEITVYDFQIAQPGQTINISEYDSFISEINLDTFKELNLKANLMMTRTNIFGGVQNLYLRGSSADQIQITYDNAVLNDPSHPSRGYNFSEFLSLNLSSIDIYDGPQSSIIGNYANAGAISMKSRDVESPTVSLKLGSYESYGHNLLIPIKKINQQWEWQSFKTRGMSSSANGEEHDGLSDHSLKVKGKFNLPESYSAKYFVLSRWRDEDLDFGGGANPDDQNYTSKEKMLLPYLEVSGDHYDCLRNVASLQKTFRKRETANDADSINSNRSYFFNRSELEVAKISLSQSCIENFSSNLVFEHNKESMNSNEQGDVSGFMEKKEQTTDSISVNQEIVLNTKNKFTIGGKVDYWEEESDIGAYRFSFAHLTPHYVLISPSFSYGRKIPSLYQLYSIYGNANLQRERNWQSELLLSKEFTNSTWEVVSFLSQYQEMVDYDFSTSKYINSGSNKIFGFEFRNFWKLNSELSQKFNINYLRAYDSKTSDELLLRPKWQGSYAINYKMNQSLVELQSQYLSSRKAVDAISFSRIETSSIFLMHVLYKYIISTNFKIDFSWQNILNKKYNHIPGYSSAGVTLLSELSYVF